MIGTRLRSVRNSTFLVALLCAGVGTAQAETFTWNNSGTNFNAAGSWTDLNPPMSSGPPGFNDIAAFSNPKVMDPVLTALSATSVLGGETVRTQTPSLLLGGE